jgi:sulfite reductase (ferredoxin)
MPDHYAIYVGGDFEGTRLSARLFDKVHLDEIGPTLEPIFAYFARHRRPGEGFGDFCHRHPPELLREISRSAEGDRRASGD